MKLTREAWPARRAVAVEARVGRSESSLADEYTAEDTAGTTRLRRRACQTAGRSSSARSVGRLHAGARCEDGRVAAVHGDGANPFRRAVCLRVSADRLWKALEGRPRTTRHEVAWRGGNTLRTRDDDQSGRLTWPRRGAGSMCRRTSPGSRAGRSPTW
ncbi:MAG: hypothetical protein ACLUW6_10820 [Coriobacteriaceae bacterium]